jgi:magnesium-transporting ATPase (P-type)
MAAEDDATMGAAMVESTASTVGLTSDEAARRLAADGPNQLPRPRSPSAVRALLAEMSHFFALLLWCAAGLAVLAGMPQLGVAIAVVVVVNGVFAFAQERRAEHAAARLRDLLPRRVVVRRDGHKVELDATQVVVGDAVDLEAGDLVPADAVIVDAQGLGVDESMLTGESVAVTPLPGATVHGGTHVVAGHATVTVTATGERTRLATIAVLTAGTVRPRSPLARELDRLVRTIARIAAAVGVAFFGVAVLLGTPPSDGFLFALGVTVALVPEGLLPTVTLSLAVAAQRMARRNGLVRHLEAVESLGAATFICTDKTGTLTANRMEVVDLWTPRGAVRVHGDGYAPTADLDGTADALEAARHLAAEARADSVGRIAQSADGAWEPAGDPMEAAIDALARRLGSDELAAPSDELAFDPVRRRASVLVDGCLIVKGAPDAVLPRCNGDVTAATAAVDALAERGLRVLAVADRRDATVAPGAEPDTVERDLRIVGLLGFLDPPRAGVADSIAACRAAGVRVAMLTGDHPTTAAAIARAIGLLDDAGLVVQGAELPTDDASLGELLDRDGVVISRVSPEDKLRIARSLRKRGHVVAMTGDGVNDGPALREADIGVAMGRSGTDVAREAADLVLLDDDFSTIVAAITQGRATFANIRRFLTYHLTDNVGELVPFVVWALTGSAIPLALGVLQILCLDIGTDMLPALALGAEPPDDRVLERPLTGRHLVDRGVLTRAFGVLGPAQAVPEMVAFIVTLWMSGWRFGDEPTESALLAASGAAFAAVVLGQAANAFACRSASAPAWRVGRRNPLVARAVAVELLLLVTFLYSPIASVLEHSGPTLAGGLIAALAAPAVLLADAASKAGVARRRARA